MEVGDHWRLRGREPPLGPTRRSMVMPWARGVHAGHAQLSPPSRFSPRRLPDLGITPGAASKLGNQLRPDRDHPDEKRDRRQRRRLFHECLQHARLLHGNIRRTLFLLCSRSQEAIIYLTPQGATYSKWASKPDCPSCPSPCSTPRTSSPSKPPESIWKPSVGALSVFARTAG